MLCPWAQSISDLDESWWVGHTKARFEKAFAWDLVRASIGHFLPMAERVLYSSGKKRRVMMPLFTSYVFFNGSPETRRTALSTGRLCQVIEVGDQAALAKELEMVLAAVQTQPRLGVHIGPVVGQRCRVISGPLEGVEGTVIERGRMARTVLEVSILGQGAVVEIEADLLEPVS